MKPLVSVILPAYNYGHFLPETLENLAGQSHPNWECIVVDDGSTDDTWDIALDAASRDHRIKYVRQSNKGLPAARNTGLDNSNGQYVQFLDADDLIETTKFAKQVEYLEQHQEIGIVYGGVRYFHTKRPFERRYTIFDPDLPWMPEVSGSGDSVLRTLIRSNIMVVNSPLVRRDTINRIGGFNESLASLEDWEYWIRCAAAGVRFQYLDVDGTLALVRIHANSMSQNRVRMLRQQVGIRKALLRTLDCAEINVQNRWHLSQELGQLGVELIRSGKRVSGLRHTLEAYWNDPTRLQSGWFREALRAMAAS